MQRQNAFLSVSLIVAFTLLPSACGGGGGGGGNPTTSTTVAPVANQSATGLWETTYQVASGANAGDIIQGTALIASTGQYYTLSVNQTNHCAEVGFGNESVAGSSVSGSGTTAIVTYAPGTTILTSCTFPDGSTSATGTYTGTVVQGSSLVLTGTATTSLGTALPAGQAVTLNFNQAFNQGASLTAIAGNYLATSGSVVSISPTGTLSATNAATGCTLTGTVSIPNASQNAYQLALSESGCTGVNVGLNGTSLSGLAYLDTSTNPNQLIVGVSGPVASHTVILVDALRKQ